MSWVALTSERASLLAPGEDYDTCLAFLTAFFDLSCVLLPCAYTIEY
jgi:hypothetical protein